MVIDPCLSLRKLATTRLDRYVFPSCLFSVFCFICVRLNFLLIYIFFPLVVCSSRPVTCADDLDVEFCNKMESVSGCQLPMSLKLEISRLIDEHCFNSGMSLSMDVTSLGNVSKEFQDMFAKMMRHICRIDARSKDLVVDIMQAISKTVPDDNDEIGSDVDRNEDNVSPVLSEREEANVVAAKVISCPFYFPP